MTEPGFTVRPATPADSRACFEVFLASITDFTRRLARSWNPDPEVEWASLEPLYRHFGEHAAEWWVAEDGAELIGYARSVERGGLFELSEFFVHPERQKGGVGAALLSRAFPDGRGEVRAIIATTDLPAQARYYAAGTVARFPIVALEGPPRSVTIDPSVEIVRATLADLPALERIDAAVLEFSRGPEFAWLLDTREGYLYRRDGDDIGYAFVSAERAGPIATLDPEDQAAVLGHLETRAAELGAAELSFEVPMMNAVAMRHLLARGFRMDGFYTFLMSSRPFGSFDRYVGMSPPFVL
jgi:GNAT superfamily N-acetyltransferase